MTKGKMEKENIIRNPNREIIAISALKFLFIFLSSALVTIGFNKYAMNAPVKKGISNLEK